LILERNGYRVVEAEDGLEGLKKAQGEPFDLIITDLEMPGMDGYSLVKQLKGSGPTGAIPIIVATAHGRLKDMFELGEKASISCLLEKPFMAEEILDKIEKLLK
jgi:CheY-like chemotaxis protein